MRDLGRVILGLVAARAEAQCPRTPTVHAHIAEERGAWKAGAGEFGALGGGSLSPRFRPLRRLRGEGRGEGPLVARMERSVMRDGSNLWRVRSRISLRSIRATGC